MSIIGFDTEQDNVSAESRLQLEKPLAAVILPCTIANDQSCHIVLRNSTYLPAVKKALKCRRIQVANIGKYPCYFIPMSVIQVELALYESDRLFIHVDKDREWELFDLSIEGMWNNWPDLDEI